MTNPGANHLLQGRRVLVVEDELLVAMEFESILRAQGCMVLGPATSVERAVALIEQRRPEAALLDLNLGGQSALQVAASLNARSVPFLIVSGYSERQSPEPELSRAPRLAKPVSHRQLVQALQQVLMTVPRR
jgi:CheY-like chemotaxis protein